MSDLSLTHCRACRAIMNPAWTSCCACGEPAQTSPASGSKPPDLDLAARLLEMSLSVFQVEGSPIEIVVPWWPVALWFTPRETDVAALIKVGVSRCRIWTTREVMDLLTIPGIDVKKVKKVAQVKAIFEGTVSA